MEKEWRLINHLPQSGYYNMAVDEALIDFYRQSKIPVLRIYQWQKPFVSLGYNQQAKNVLVGGFDDFTRRITGGAAILHGNELTYSLVCSKEDLALTGDVKASYKKLSSFLVAFYFRLGLKASFACDDGVDTLGHYGDICFASREHYDILIDGKKIGGNAQKRGRDYIFQHGSIPLDIDFEVMAKRLMSCGFDHSRVASLKRYLKKDQDHRHLRDIFADSFRERFGVRMIDHVLSDNEETYCQDLMERKYLTYAWKYKT